MLIGLVGISVAVVVPLIFIAFRVNSISSFVREEWLPDPIHGTEDAQMDELHDSDTGGPQTFKPDEKVPTQQGEEDEEEYAPLFGIYEWNRKVPVLRRLWKYRWYWHALTEDEQKNPSGDGRQLAKSQPRGKRGKKRKPGYPEKGYPLQRFLLWVTKLLDRSKSHRPTETEIVEEIVSYPAGGRSRRRTTRIVEERIERRPYPRTSRRRSRDSSYSDSYVSRYSRERPEKKPSIFVLLLVACLGALGGWCPPWKKRSTVRRRSFRQYRSGSPPIRRTSRVSRRSSRPYRSVSPPVRRTSRVRRRFSRSYRSISPPVRRISHVHFSTYEERREKKTTFKGFMAAIGLLFKALWSGVLSCCTPWRKRKRDPSPARSNSYYSYSSSYDSSYDTSYNSSYDSSPASEDRRRRPTRRRPFRRRRPDDDVIVIEENSPVGSRRSRRRSSSSSRIRPNRRPRLDSDDIVEAVEEHSSGRRRVSDSSDSEEEPRTTTRRPLFPKLAHLPAAIQQRLVRRRDRRNAREEIVEVEEGRAGARRRQISTTSSRSRSRSRSRSLPRPHSRR